MVTRVASEIAPDSYSAEGLSYREREATAIPASFILPTIRVAAHPVACATCQEPIDTGNRYREDRLRELVFGQLLVSAICTPCIAEGL